MIDLNDSNPDIFSSKQAVDHIKKYIDKISCRYTKHYQEPVTSENFYM